MTPHTHTAAAILPDQRAASPASNLPQADAGAFAQLKATVADLERRAAKLKGRDGYHAMLSRLCNARSALLNAENKLNRN